MFTSLLRQSAAALVTIAMFGAASPALAGGYQDPQVIYADDGDDYSAPQQDYQQDYQQEEQQDEYSLISPRKILSGLRHQGYGAVQEISLRGDEYRVVAVRHNGAVVRLKIDGQSGDILSECRIGWVRNTGYQKHVRPYRNQGLTIQFGYSTIR